MARVVRRTDFAADRMTSAAPTGCRAGSRHSHGPVNPESRGPSVITEPESDKPRSYLRIARRNSHADNTLPSSIERWRSGASTAEPPVLHEWRLADQTRVHRSPETGRPTVVAVRALAERREFPTADGWAKSRYRGVNCERRPLPGAIEALRNRQVKNFFALELLAVETPMLSMGDEVRRTQDGNNNAYCLDGDRSWFDWSLLDRHADIHRFVTELTAFRQRRDVVVESAALSLIAASRVGRVARRGAQ